MKVLILTKTFPETENDWGGIFVKEQADALIREHEVIVVKFKNDETDFKPFFRYKVREETDLKYRFFIIIVSRSFPVYNQFNYILCVYFALNKILKGGKVDIIHCHYSYPAGVIARLINLKLKIPYIITEHSKIKQTFRSSFHKKLSLYSLRYSCMNISVSNALKNELVAEGINKVEVVPNVIDTGRFSLAGRSAGPFRIGFLGSLNTHNKGLDLLLKSCSVLPIDFILKIGGTGLHFEYYKDLAHKMGIAGKCIFTGEISKMQISNFYSDLNLFVLPSRYETFGIVLVEAMSSGLPVISTRCGGPEEIINEQVGILTDTDNSDQIKDAIMKIYSNYSEYKPEEIRNYAFNNWGIDPFLKKINSIYQRCFSK